MADLDEGVVFSGRKLSDLSDEISSVAIDWKPFRASAVCTCATSLDQIVEKVMAYGFQLLGRITIDIN